MQEINEEQESEEPEERNVSQDESEHHLENFEASKNDPETNPEVNVCFIFILDSPDRLENRVEACH